MINKNYLNSNITYVTIEFGVRVRVRVCVCVCVLHLQSTSKERTK
jgi:hypothetical protein